MTLKIEVTVPEEAIHDGVGRRYLGLALETLGFYRSPTSIVGNEAADNALRSAAAAPQPNPVEEAVKEVVEAQKRERGKPAPGRARRTKEEIAEDEAAAAAEAEPAAAISTGEERIDPAHVAEQDAEDEAAEVEEHRDQAAPLTVDDVKAVVGDYVARYGMAAVQEDGPKIFVEALGNPPAGQAYWKMSILPDDQAKLARVVEVWKKAVALNPLKREVVGG